MCRIGSPAATETPAQALITFAQPLALPAICSAFMARYRLISPSIKKEARPSSHFFFCDFENQKKKASVWSAQQLRTSLKTSI